MRIVLIGALGAVGALTRFELSRAIHRRTEHGGVPTMVVNLAGAILFGGLVGVDARAPFEPDLFAALSVGFLGGFTTFSTWMVDAVFLADEGREGRRRGALNLAFTLIGGIASYTLVRTLVSP